MKIDISNQYKWKMDQVRMEKPKIRYLDKLITDIYSQALRVGIKKFTKCHPGHWAKSFEKTISENCYFEDLPQPIKDKVFNFINLLKQENCTSKKSIYDWCEMLKLKSEYIDDTEEWMDWSAYCLVVNISIKSFNHATELCRSNYI